MAFFPENFSQPLQLLYTTSREIPCYNVDRKIAIETTPQPWNIQHQLVIFHRKNICKLWILTQKTCESRNRLFTHSVLPHKRRSESSFYSFFSALSILLYKAAISPSVKWSPMHRLLLEQPRTLFSKPKNWPPHNRRAKRGDHFLIIYSRFSLAGYLSLIKNRT